jgi:hypothetical protein
MEDLLEKYKTRQNMVQKDSVLLGQGGSDDNFFIALETTEFIDSYELRVKKQMEDILDFVKQ